MDKESVKKSIYFIFAASLVVSIWGILEHFGHSFSCLIFPQFKTFDVSCWVQDVQNRVYATLGQPNWLAAWVVSLLPLTWAFMISYKIREIKFYLFYLLGITLFLTLLFTQSRSGLLGLGIAALIFWSLYLFHQFGSSRKNLNKFISTFLLINLSIILLTLIVGTPWTPAIDRLTKNSDISVKDKPLKQSAPALETGGTESGEIRKIVWNGAIDIWKNYPIFGTGPETFAFSYYLFRPVAHNLVSEWDYLYNKAHNEYLNYLATTGSLGTLSYLLVIGFSIFLFLRNIRSQGSDKDLNTKLLIIGLLSGYISILITNFFGFSVVLIGQLFLLLPAFAAVLIGSDQKNQDKTLNTSTLQKAFMLMVIIVLYFLNKTVNYWQTDLLYAKGKLYSDAGDYPTSINFLSKAIDNSPGEAIYHEELATALANLSVHYFQNDSVEDAKTLASNSISESNRAMSLSNANVNIKRSYSANLINLSVIDPTYMILAKDVLEKAVTQAPTDAKLFYNLSLVELRTGDNDKAKELLIKTIDMKSNYALARQALALIYTDEKEVDKAKEQYEYILKYIDPGNENIKRELDELK